MSGLNRAWLIAGMVVVLAWGLFVRSYGVGARPFWQDEAWVAEAVRRSDCGDLLHQIDVPLPPMFALTAKAFARLPIAPELALRLPALVCGVSLLPLVFRVARTLRAPRTVALAGMALCASSLMLVIWSRELKQYVIEAFLAVVLALCVFRLRRSPARRWPWGTGLLLICLAGPWVGYGVVFPALALLATLVILRPRSGRWRTHFIVGVGGLALLAVSVVTVRNTIAARQAADEALQLFMGRWFIDVANIRSWLRAGAYGAGSTTMMLFPSAWTVDPVVLVGLAALIWGLAVIGLATWPRSGRLEMALWTAVPWLLLIVAAVAKRYPFGAMRLMVFLAPPLLIAVAAGCIRVARTLSLVVLQRGGPGMVAGLVLAFAPMAFMHNLPLRRRYWVWHDYPAVLRVLQRERRPDELVLVSVHAASCVRHYAGADGAEFTFMPVASGTLPVPHFDYHGFLDKTVQRAGTRWWLLCESGEAIGNRERLPALLRRRGYEMRLVAEGGTDEDHEYHVAQLYAIGAARR